MRKIYLFILLVTAFTVTKAQVKIATPAELTATPLPDASSMLEVKTTTRGILIPRMTTMERDAIPSPAISLLIFNTTNDQFEYYAALPTPGWVPLPKGGTSAGWLTTGNTGTTAATNFLGTIDEKSLAFRTFNQHRVLIDSVGRVGIGTMVPNSVLNVFGNNTPGFAFGANQFFVGVYSRPTRLNTAASNISYGLLSHSNADNLGTYNAVAGRILRTADTSLANLTAALGHVNNGGNFQTALLGTVNSRLDQANDGVRYSAAWLRTPNPAALNAAQLATTYTIFAPDTIKSYFEGNVGIGTNNPNSRINILGNSTPGFAFGASQFFVGLYSRPTRLNVAATNISYGILSHTNSDATGTYNALAGRALRTTDTSLANLTAALIHINNGGNFQTAVLGITNSRIDQSGDAQNFSAARFTDATGSLNSAQDSSTYTIFASSTRKNYFEGSIGVGTSFPNSRINVLGNNTPGFAWGANQFFVGVYSRPLRLNTAATNISYGLLSHTNADATGTYNAVAGRVLRTADTSLANLTAALAHVNNGGNFQTALLGTVNSRLDQANDGVRYSSAWLRTPNPSALSAAQLATTYTIFAPDTTKSYFEGNIGIGTNSPNSRINVFGNNTDGFAFGASQFFVGVYSRPTRLNTAATNISYGLLSHSNADNLGTYNAIAGRILRTGDTSMANLTAALGHVNNGGNFQTALLGTINSRLNESTDAQVFSAARLTAPVGTLTSNQTATTYTVFAPDSIKKLFKGAIGVNTNAPSTSVDVDGGLTIRAAAAVSLTADDQAVTVGNRSYVRINSNDVTAANRTFTISNGLQIGQVLIIENSSANGAEIVDGGNVNSAGNITFTAAGSTVSFIWNGTQWVETSRSNN